MTIREASSDDILSLEKVYQDFLAAMAEYDPKACDLDVAARMQSSLEREDTALFVAEHTNGIIGLIRMQRKQRDGDGTVPIKYMKLTDLYVQPEHRKQGVASSLIRRAIQYSHQNGLSEVMLKVDEPNRSAHRLYRSLGFVDDCSLDHARIRMVYHD